ncbi:MAG: peptidoglycan DD-metalloendopeptidase family protein [Candidatus Methylomirabilales bacterium]
MTRRTATPAPRRAPRAPSPSALLPLVLLLAAFACLPALVPSALAKTRPRSRPAGVTHVVARGQTLFRISEAYRVPVAAILEANRLKPKAPLRVGQRLLIPGVKRAVRVAAARPLSSQEREGLELSLREPPPAEPPPAVPVTRLKTDAALLWPILGAVNSPFGPRWGRLHAGIDIGSPQYQEVVAAADGEVIYAGESRGPLGQAVILQHADGLRTVYAHLSLIVAEEGETVRQGQPIGGVGSTGRSTGPHLHFEVRVNGARVDPLQYLPATLDELVTDLARARAAERERP